MCQDTEKKNVSLTKWYRNILFVDFVKRVTKHLSSNGLELSSCFVVGQALQD